jgi:hypothetical protein
MGHRQSDVGLTYATYTHSIEDVAGGSSPKGEHVPHRACLACGPTRTHELGALRHLLDGHTLALSSLIESSSLVSHALAASSHGTCRHVDHVAALA